MAEANPNNPASASITPPPDLEARLDALDIAAPRSDFGRAGWFWLILLGIVVPIILLVIGWRL